MKETQNKARKGVVGLIVVFAILVLLLLLLLAPRSLPQGKSESKIAVMNEVHKTEEVAAVSIPEEPQVQPEEKAKETTTSPVVIQQAGGRVTVGFNFQPTIQ